MLEKKKRNCFSFHSEGVCMVNFDSREQKNAEQADEIILLKLGELVLKTGCSTT